ncbi:LOW QUALITY PROTEIN: little elongation complex subunit 1 [Artibeus jamaicensis]|uniref:LOW QUALITY PROTEIN: little elongation complex subunit 1 n=1 Tax=Artibeus jamaicensis TaxID=9417 RepID=UPI00235A6626|nr:LOW QUALITY PROTEIN: little elongation complex subunit 1 [Artibeus jamaicensis]
MMPGETHSAAPGAAADLSRCQGCASLQQNLNEYVEALITLKQKIINTDNLLTEYQKKCDELQFARRENSTLHHQVEQMLQKISPLQKCQEELGSLKAELEEKKSSLKLYQDTHQEYARVKEECLKTDAQKKKLEAKVKKLEEAALKQTQDFKQLRNEKKILEKEFKKTQERLDEFSKQKNEKELKHIGTQISSDCYGSIDKRKIKLLLKELWLCINTTHRVPGESSRCLPAKPAEEKPRSRESGEDGVPTRVEGSPPRASAVQTCLAELSMEIEGDFSPCKNVRQERPSGAAHPNEDQPPEVVMPRNDEDSTEFLHGSRFFDEDLQAAVDFFKLPPPLLSPVPSPPLGSLPHLGTLPSSLAPETYFGEYTDSSDNDSAQHRNSAESNSEDDTSDTQDCFGSPRKNKGSGTWEEKPNLQGATEALNTLEANEVTAVGFGALTATLREPSATFTLAHEEHWALSSQLISGKKRGISGEAKGQREVREMDKSVQTEETLCKPTRSVSVERLSGSLTQGKEAALGTSDMCYSPLGKRPLNELPGSEGKTPFSRMIGSSKSDFTKWTPTNELTCESDHMSVSDHHQGISRELEKDREGQGFILGESPEPEEDSDDVMDATELDVEAKFSSSSTSGALSVYSNPQSSSGLKCGHDKHIPTELCHSEQKLQATTSNLSGLQSEPLECCAVANNLENSFHALNPELGASDFHDQSSSGKECTKVVKGMTKVYSLPQSVFMKAMKGGQCESQGPGGELTPSQSDFAPLVESRSGLIKSGFGFVKSTSWHHSDLLRRGSEERLRAKSEHEREQETNHQLQKAMLSLEKRGSTSFSSNQVSVITKQARPEATQSARSEPLRLHRSEPALATEKVDNVSSIARCGEREDPTQIIKGVAATKRTSPESSKSWRKLDSDSPGGSLPVENSHCSTKSKLSFFPENIPVPNQNVTEPAVQAELREQCPPLNVTGLDSSGTGAGKLPPAAEMAVSRSLSVEKQPREETVRSGGKALAISKDSPSREQSPEGSLEQPSQTPSGTSPEGSGTTGTAFSPEIGRKDEETHALPQSSLPGSLYCYTGIREVGGVDTEVEESEAPSCSEGENEPEAAPGNQQWDAAKSSRGDVGAARTAAAETRPSTELGCLTSALQDFNIGTLSEIDRLSTSDVVMFLESCQLRDYSSGDSVSEYSNKESLNKDTNKESKQSETSGEKSRKQLGDDEETLKTCEEWIESEEDDCALRDASHLTQCSLETLSEVLTKIGQELQSNYEDSDGKDAGNLLLFSIHDSLTTEHLKERVSPQQISSSSLHPSDPPPATAGLGAKGSSPTSGVSTVKSTQDRLEGNSNVTGLMGSGGEVLSELAELPAKCSDSGAGQTAEPGAGCESEGSFQCQISTVTSEVINVLVNKDQNLVIEKGDNWTIINGVALMPNVDQVILCDTPGDNPASPDGGETEGAGFISPTSVDKSPETSHPGSPLQESPGGSNLPCTPEDISNSGQSSNFDKSRLRNRPVKPSVRISSEIYDQIFESQIVASDHTYYNSKLEPFVKNKNRSKISNKDQSNKLVKTSSSGRVETNPSEVSQSPSADSVNTKAQRPQTQTILANADTSTPMDCSTDTLSKIRQEVGPPLPPLLAPLIATPPRTSHPVSPLISSSSPSSPTSPVGQLSPLCEIPVPPIMSPLLEDARRASPSCTSPSPSAVSTGERILSSPLQFCATTPKHALPVPGRLPPCASAHTTVAGPQENSIKILDTMYPELSARARTLNILKGNIQLTRGPPADRQNLPGPVSAITGFKAISSMSTAFVKTGGSSGGDCNQDKSRDLGTQQDPSGKRTLSACILRSAKRLRLDSGSSESEGGSTTSEGVNKPPCRNLPQAEVAATDEEPSSVSAASSGSQLPLNPKETVESHDKAIADALKKIAESSFDLLPVIRSHVYVGNISKKPVMRDQEKEVVYDFSTTKKHLAECLLHSILSELKLQKTSLEHNYIHALCRVYVGICRQLGDVERARLFCYSLLKEDFPESEKLTLFIANMWHDIFISQSVINKAMQLVARQRAKGEVLNCLRAFLNWEKNSPADVGFMVSKLLLTIQLCPKTEFQSSERFGEDLSDNTWEYIFAIDLLCCHQKWVWTHDNIISKELWPVMDKWIKHRKGHANIAYIPDVIIASILRLIGRLGQLGLKEGFPSAVKNISSVIGMFIQHAQDEDIPWGIQLAAVYALCDLSPSNPAEISKILEAWRKDTSHSVPSAVVSSLEEVSALCAGELG